MPQLAKGKSVNGLLRWLVPLFPGGTFPRRWFFFLLAFDFFAALLAANFPTLTQLVRKTLAKSPPNQYTHTMGGSLCCRFSARFSLLAAFVDGETRKTRGRN